MSCQAEASNHNASNLASRLLNFVVISASVLFFSNTLKKQREHTDQQLNEFAGILNQIVEKLNETMQQPQQQAAKEITSRPNLGYLIISSMIFCQSWLADKYVIGEQQTAENNRLLQLLELGDERELKKSFCLASKRMCEKDCCSLRRSRR